MRSALRSVTALTAILASVVVFVAVFTSTRVGDYTPLEAVQNPAPAIGALAQGSLGRFVDLHPVMGSFSLLVRAPGVAVSDAFGGGTLLGYRLGALVCFVPAVILGAWLAREIDARGRSRLEAVGTGVLVAVNPITLDALHAGHPEEVLGGGLAVLAVVCAARRRLLLAAVALGLATGTKQWALLAVLPTLLAVPAGARRTPALVAGAIGLALALGAPLADWSDYRVKAQTLGQTTTVSRYSAWQAVSQREEIAVPSLDRPTTIRRLPGGLSREQLGLAIPVVCTLVVLAFARQRRWRLAEQEAMALLAISFLLRVTLDSTVLLYYFAPMLLALAWWEVRRRGLPLWTAAATAFLWQLFSHGDVVSETLVAVAVVAGSVVVCAYALSGSVRSPTRAET